MVNSRWLSIVLVTFNMQLGLFINFAASTPTSTFAPATPRYVPVRYDHFFTTSPNGDASHFSTVACSGRNFHSLIRGVRNGCSRIAVKNVLSDAVHRLLQRILYGCILEIENDFHSRRAGFCVLAMTAIQLSWDGWPLLGRILHRNPLQYRLNNVDVIMYSQQLISDCHLRIPLANQTCPDFLPGEDLDVFELRLWARLSLLVTAASKNINRRRQSKLHLSEMCWEPDLRRAETLYNTEGAWRITKTCIHTVRTIFGSMLRNCAS